MSDIVKMLGQRIRGYRAERKLSQEQLAELAGCHPTYIGQLERGEKNATVESVGKIASALGISLSVLFEMPSDTAREGNSIPLACYELLSSKSVAEQEQLYRVLLDIDQYKSK